MPTTRGLVPIRDRGGVATTDSVQVGRLRRAGAIVVGKTNTPADGHVAITKNLIGPPSRNPWSLDRSPGGSSGGSAAAVASRMVPWATASDGGGSIRIPAALTGTFGHKPTRGLIPFPPARDGVASWLRTSVNGPITRSVIDAAIYIDFTAGYDPTDPDSAVPTLGAAVGFQASLAAPQPMRRRLRVGFVETLVPGFEMQPDVARCVATCISRLRDIATRAWGADAVVYLPNPATPRFGKEWTTAVGAYRLARFARDGLTEPPVADRFVLRLLSLCLCPVAR
jgi:Asp-tRNA(Asn)/Glu-tRNA(Gln) amidotransferase A subunit family amidase